MKKIIVTLVIAIATLSLVSCKDWLDINYDPNSATPAMVTNDNIFPAAEMALCASYGDFFRITGGYFAQQYAQSFGTSNYVDFSQFTMSQTRSSSFYSQIMQGCISNATVIRDNAAADNQWGTYLAATTLRVFAFQALVDAYGEVPYTESMDAENYPNPHFDEGATVYEGILAELDEALSKVSETDAVATNFLYTGQSAANWIKFANALKLKILMRESGKVNVDSQLTALVNQNNFPTEDVAWKGFWANASGKANPYYQEEFATYFGSTQINVALNVALFRTMNAYNDARLAAFFEPNTSGQYWGSISGDNLSTSLNYKKSFCRPKMAYNTPVVLISVAEVNFWLAEYFASKDAAKAKRYYEAAIEASFDAAGVDGASAAITAWPFDNSNVAKCIGVQKWVALSGVNNYEAWCELRRLGYPAFGNMTADDIYDRQGDNMNASALPAGELYTPYKYDTEVGQRTTIQRWPYALVSSQSNINCPEVKLPNVKVFWAK